MNVGSRYVGPLGTTYRREMLLMVFNSPVITWQAKLHMMGEFAHVQ
jgi:hypothetical protein